MAVLAADAQQGRRAADSGTPADLRVDVSLAIIPVTVTNSFGEPVFGLRLEDFKLFEDGVEQKIAHLDSADRPVSIALVFDLSASMKKKMPTAAEAIRQLLASFDLPDDEFCLILFNEHPRIAVPFTRDAQEVTACLSHARPLGRTALLDAIHLARAQMRVAHNTRKVIVAVSDGGDNHSRLTPTDIRMDMRESDVQLYAMGISRAEPEGLPTLAIEELNGPGLLNEIAHQTGGRFVELTRLSDLPATCADIAHKLHNQYLLAYSPSSHDARSHRIQVKVAGGVGYTVVHRSELYVPAH